MKIQQHYIKCSRLYKTKLFAIIFSTRYENKPLFYPKQTLLLIRFNYITKTFHTSKGSFSNLLNSSKEIPKSFLKFIWCFYIYFMSYSMKHLKFSINQHICKFYRGIFVRTVFFTVNY